LSDKLDGVSAQLYKNKNGKIFMYSRGNGNEGQDISHLVSYFVDKNILNKIPNDTSVRGELIISKDNFKKISSYMKNGRNAVAGLVNSKTVDKKIANLTNFVTYSILYPRYKQSNQFLLLKKYGFIIVDNKSYKNLSDDILKQYLLQRKINSIYEIDGIVCQDDFNEYDQTVAYPDNAFAFKMLLEDQIAIADVVKIEWEVSMDGYLKPRVQIKPIELTGITITYATGHNAKFIVDHQLGPGAKIKIVRSGDVIPYILGVVKHAKIIQLPYENPTWNKTQVDIIVEEDDPRYAQTIKLKLLSHFFSTMGIKFLGEGILKKFVEEGFDTVKKVIDGLNNKKNIFIQIEGIGEKIIKKIQIEIKKSFDEVELSTLMAASHKFGRGMGKKKLEEVLQIYPEILIETNTKKELFDKIIKVKGFAEKSANLFAKNFNKFKIFFNELSQIIDLTRFEIIEINKSSESDISDKNKKLINEKIVFTQCRDVNLEKFIKNNGGKVTTSVTGNTTMVIHKDNADISKGKLQDALKKGIKIISLSEFIKKYID
jgi:NAD-dependent DNA ligase